MLLLKIVYNDTCIFVIVYIVFNSVLIYYDSILIVYVYRYL
nr:MAG TPA: hypothetical protein [Caudoviricetes sp.]